MIHACSVIRDCEYNITGPYFTWKRWGFQHIYGQSILCPLFALNQAVAKEAYINFVQNSVCTYMYYEDISHEFFICENIFHIIGLRAIISRSVSTHPLQLPSVYEIFKKVQAHFCLLIFLIIIFFINISSTVFHIFKRSCSLVTLAC